MSRPARAPTSWCSTPIRSTTSPTTRRIASVYLRGRELPRADNAGQVASRVRPRPAQQETRNDAGGTAMRHLIGLSLACAFLSVAVLADERGAKPEQVSARRAGGQGQQRPHGRAARRGEPGTVRHVDLEVRQRARVHRAARREVVESGQDQADAGRQGRRRHGPRASAIRTPIAPWPTPATTSSGPRCSTTPRHGTMSCARGRPARARRRCPARASPTPTSARSSARSTAARWCWWCRPSIRSRKPARRWTGPISRRSASAARAAAPPLRPRCGAASPAATGRRSTTIWS